MGKQKDLGWNFANSWLESPLPPWVQELLMHSWAQEISLSESPYPMQLVSSWDQPCTGRTQYEGFFCFVLYFVPYPLHTHNPKSREEAPCALLQLEASVCGAVKSPYMAREETLSKDTNRSSSNGKTMQPNGGALSSLLSSKG